MNKLKALFSEKKYRTLFIILGILSIFIIVGAIAAVKYGQKPVKTATASKTSTAKVNSLLDGMGYSADLANRHPLAVSIENHPDARPQSGLNKASIVYEAITEGGITRYLAIFGPQDVSEIGPIRSARLFFMDWLKEYDAFFAHAGGNEDALANIGNYQIKDLDHSGNYFYRDSKGRRVASEHTLYSSSEKLYEYAKSKGFDISSSNFTPMIFKKEGSAPATGKGVQIDFSGNASYVVRWNYDPSTNSYLRFLAGSEHKDRTTDEQIKAKNIVIQTVERTYQPTGSYGSQNYVFKTVGSGPATILRDGTVLNGTWKKDSLTSRTKFYDETNKEIEFNPGATWYEIINPDAGKQPEFI